VCVVCVCVCVCVPVRWEARLKNEIEHGMKSAMKWRTVKWT
jgi:hypothetical protein